MILSNNTLKKNHIDLIRSDELFKNVPAFRRYYISNSGRLLHKNSKGKYTIVNPSITAGGYLSYTLSKKGKKPVCTTANRLVSLVFNYNPYEDLNYPLEVLDSHHKDHKRTNNYFKNLMWLSNGKSGSRADHAFINSIKKIALYDDNKEIYHTYRDIERLLQRIDIDILELIDILKDKTTPQIKDGFWTTYRVNDVYVGVEYYKRNK